MNKCDGSSPTDSYHSRLGDLCETPLKPIHVSNIARIEAPLLAPMAACWHSATTDGTQMLRMTTICEILGREKGLPSRSRISACDHDKILVGVWMSSNSILRRLPTNVYKEKSLHLAHQPEDSVKSKV